MQVCVCDGPVEVWLRRLVASMQSALSHEYKAAVQTYDEKPRVQWLFDYSVQNTITVSRTLFTQEIAAAFEALEDGKDNALKVP